MNDEMTLRYLYYLTHMYAGTKEWKRFYQAWSKFGNSISSEDYNNCLKKLAEFHIRYGIKESERGIQ